MYVENTKERGHGNTPNQLGLSKNVGPNGSLDSNTPFSHDLQPGEIPIAQYDVHIPGKRMPAWFFWMMCCMTCGCFYICMMIDRCCIKCGCRIPFLIKMYRGKMVVTNYKRVLVWRTDVTQVRTGRGTCWACFCPYHCAPPNKYESYTQTRTYAVHNISDVSLFMNQRAAFLLHCCCCEEQYESGVRVRFGVFDVNGNTPTVRVSSIGDFQKDANTFFGKIVSALAALAGLFVQLAALPDPFMLDYVEISSFREDSVRLFARFGGGGG